MYTEKQDEVLTVLFELYRRLRILEAELGQE